MHDVYAYGVIASSTLYELSDPFPPAAGYAEVAAIHPSIGGEAAGSAYVLARLGVATKLDGNRLGDDGAGARALDILTKAGVDCSAVTLETGAASVTEVVFAVGDGRTVFGTYGKLTADRAWNAPSETDIRSSRIVCVDPFFLDESLQVARTCREAGIPYITVDTPPGSEMARNAEVLVISEEFAIRTIGVREPSVILAAYVEQCPGLVILTQGSERLLYGRRGSQPEEFTPFAVDVRDTTGAGDSFRAGIIYGMLHGYSDRELITTASAVAGLVCQRVPGVLGSPTEQELEEFLGRGPDAGRLLGRE